MELLPAFPFMLVDDQPGGIRPDRQIPVAGGGDQIAGLSYRRIEETVLGQHGLGGGRLIDVQPDVYAQLHITGAAAVVVQGQALHTVIAGPGAVHLDGAFRGEPPALGVDGVDQLTLRLVGEAAQGIHGAGEYRRRAPYAVLDGPGPQRVAQSDAVIGDIEGRHLLGDGCQILVVKLGAHKVPLGPSEALRIIRGQVFPRLVEQGPVTGSAVVIHLAEGVADALVVGVGGILAPSEKRFGGIRGAGKHVEPVGLAAGVAGNLGDGAGVTAGLVCGAQFAQQALLQIVGDRGSGAGQHNRSRQPEQDAAAQYERQDLAGSFHGQPPLIALKVIYITIDNSSIA